MARTNISFYPTPEVEQLIRGEHKRINEQIAEKTGGKGEPVSLSQVIIDLLREAIISRQTSTGEVIPMKRSRKRRSLQMNSDVFVRIKSP